MRPIVQVVPDVRSKYDRMENMKSQQRLNTGLLVLSATLLAVVLGMLGVRYGESRYNAGFKRSAEVGAQIVIEEKSASYQKGYDTMAAEAKIAAEKADVAVNAANEKYLEKLKADQAVALVGAEARGEIKAKADNCDLAKAEHKRLKAVLDQYYRDIGEFGYQVAATSINELLAVSTHVCEIR